MTDESNARTAAPGAQPATEETGKEVIAQRWTPPTHSPTESVLATIYRIALDPTVSIEKMQALLEMQRDILRDQERREFNRAMAEVKKVLPQVVKNAENTDTRSQYATLGAIGDAIDPVIAEHGFTFTCWPSDSQKPNHLGVDWILAHDGGFERKGHADIPTDAAGLKGTVNKTPTHAFGSTMQYGRRYLTMMLFDVKSRKAMPDDDGNAAGGGMDMASDEQLAALTAIAAKADRELSAVLEWAKVDDIAKLTAAKCDEAIAQLTRRAERIAKGTKNV